jgi:hypothetical protein
MAVKASGAVKAWQEDVRAKDKTLVYSVPHSGTHFAMHFLEELGIKTMQFHSQETSLVRAYQCQGIKCVIPFRHPYKVFVSHWERNDTLRALGWEAYMTLLVHHYTFMIQTVDLFDYVTLQVDCPEGERLGQLIRVGQHVGSEPFRLENVSQHGQPRPQLIAGNKATEVISKWANEWPIVGWRKYKHPIPDSVEWGRLDAVLEWCGYEPMDMTGYWHREGEETQEVHAYPASGIDLVMPKVEAKGTAVVRRKDGSTVNLEIST